MIPFKIDKKTLTLHQFIVLMFIFSVVFSIYYVMKSHNSLTNYLYIVIYTDKTSVVNYTICSILYIIILVIASSSYAGLPVISLSITYRFLALVYSLIQINQFNFLEFIIYLIPQMMIELLLTYIMTYMSLQLTLQTLKLSFFQKGNYNIKVLLNYILSYILVAVILIFLSCLIKTYLL